MAISIEPFNRLVKLTARAFYDDDITTSSKTGRKVDNRGIAVVILEALSRRQWVREEDLAKDLKLNPKQLRRALRFFEEEKLVARDHRKERQAKKEGEDKIKMYTHSYCCLDYAQMYDVVRYRLQRMKKRLEDESKEKNTVQIYLCNNCGNRYNALDALQLNSMEDEYFHCVRCSGKLVVVIETDHEKASSQVVDGESNISRRERREKSKAMLQNMEEQLKPLMEQIYKVKDLPVPQFGTLRDWEAGAKSSDGVVDDFLGTKVDVDITWGNNGDDMKSKLDDDTTTTSLAKVFPPWLNKQGNNNSSYSNDEQHEEFSDDKKANSHEDNEGKSTLQEEYYKAYYNALLQRQQQEEANNREVGMKSKRDQSEEEDEEDIDWQEG